MINFTSAKILKLFVPASVKHLHLAAAKFGSYYKQTFWWIFVSPAKQKRDICIAFPVLSSSSAVASA